MEKRGISLNIVNLLSSNRKHCHLVIAISTILYCVIFSQLLRTTNDPSSARVGFLLVLFVGYSCGKVSGSAFGFIVNMCTGILIIAHSKILIPFPEALLNFIVGTIFFTSAGFITGWISDMTLKLKEEIIARKKAEKELAAYKDHLEELVEKRTKELELANDRIRQTEKMEALGQLTGGIAHDFNNLLFAIAGMVEMIELKFGKSNEGINYYTKNIEKTINEAANFIKTLMTFARKNKKENSSLDMHELIDSSISLLSHSLGKRIIIESSFEASETTIKGNYSLLQNVFLNLGSNARDAMPEGGKLFIKTVNRHSATSLLDPLNSQTPPYLEITVSDTGEGIEEDKLRKIFEPFYTTKPIGKGTGMGLSSTLGTIEMHNGTIEVNSTPGEGTAFTIILPCHNIEKEEIAA